MNKLYLWAKRYSTAWGWHWVIQREVMTETADSWLNVFRKDEPSIEFLVSNKKPKP